MPIRCLQYVGADNAFNMQIGDLNRRCRGFENLNHANVRGKILLYVRSVESVVSVYTQPQPERSQWVRQNLSQFYNLLQDLQELMEQIDMARCSDAELVGSFRRQRVIHQRLLREIGVAIQPQPDIPPPRPAPNPPPAPPAPPIPEKSPCCNCCVIL